jgi:hypothetical protein
MKVVPTQPSFCLLKQLPRPISLAGLLLRRTRASTFCDAGHIPKLVRNVRLNDPLRGEVAMSTITQASTGSIGLRNRISAVLNDPDFCAVTVFSAVGLLVSALGLFYFMSHFPSLVDDAMSLAQYL